MNKMKPLSISLIFLFAVWFPIFGQADTSLKIGFIGPFSGPAQAYGEAARNGFELAIRELGDTSMHIIYEDDQFTPSKTVTAFNKVSELDKVDLVICIASATCNAIAPLAETRHMPLIGWASDRNVSLNRKFVMRSYPSGEAEGQKTGEEGIGACFFLEDENENKIANGALTGAWYVTLPVSAEFKNTYKQKYGNENAITGAAVHYDLANLLHLVTQQGLSKDIIENMVKIGQITGPAGLMKIQRGDGDQFFNYSLAAKEVPAVSVIPK